MQSFTAITWILLAAMASGTILLIGTMILLFFRRVYLDSKTGKPTIIKIPVFGTLQTQAPVLVMILTGASLVAYPIYQLKTISNPNASTSTTIPVRGTVRYNGSTVDVSATALAATEEKVYGDSYDLRVPLLENTNYQLRFIQDRCILDAKPIVISGNAAEVPFTDLTQNLHPCSSSPEQTPRFNAIKEVPDEKLKSLSIR